MRDPPLSPAVADMARPTRNRGGIDLAATPDLAPPADCRTQGCGSGLICAQLPTGTYACVIAGDGNENSKKN